MNKPNIYEKEYYDRFEISEEMMNSLVSGTGTTEYPY